MTSVARSIRPWARPETPHRRHAGDEREHADERDGVRDLVQRHGGDRRRDERRETPHQRIGDGQIGVAIEAADQQEIDDVDERRGDHIRQRRRERRGRGETDQHGDDAGPQGDARRAHELVVGALDHANSTARAATPRPAPPPKRKSSRPPRPRRHRIIMTLASRPGAAKLGRSAFHWNRLAPKAPHREERRASGASRTTRGASRLCAVALVLRLARFAGGSG